jgi:hypothetical protein
MIGDTHFASSPLHPVSLSLPTTLKLECFPKVGGRISAESLGGVLELAETWVILQLFEGMTSSERTTTVYALYVTRVEREAGL